MRVVVLMSTYNGALYVHAQLESILNQLPSGGRVLIRDDGSSDGTVTRIQALNDARIQVIAGPNMGFARSFLELLRLAPDDADMYLLADQDDIWLPDKLQRAQQTIKSARTEVVLYCSRAQLVTAGLRPIGLTPDHEPARHLRTALIQNIATGCTVAISPALRRLAITPVSLHLIGFHDWWLYVLATTFGHVTFDRQPTVLYRQHGGNVIGMGGGIRRYVNVARFLTRSNWLRTMNQQIWALRQTFWKELSATQQDDIRLLQTSAGALNRSSILLSRSTLTSSLLDDALFRLLVLLDRRNSAIDRAPSSA